MWQLDSFCPSPCNASLMPKITPILFQPFLPGSQSIIRSLGLTAVMINRNTEINQSVCLSSFHSQCLEQSLIHSRNLLYNYWTNEKNQGGRVCLSQLKTTYSPFTYSSKFQQCDPIMSSVLTKSIPPSSVMISLGKKGDFDYIFPIPYPISKTFTCWGYPKCLMLLLTILYQLKSPQYMEFFKNLRIGNVGHLGSSVH